MASQHDSDSHDPSVACGPGTALSSNGHGIFGTPGSHFYGRNPLETDCRHKYCVYM